MRQLSFEERLVPEPAPRRRAAQPRTRKGANGKRAKARTERRGFSLRLPLFGRIRLGWQGGLLCGVGGLVAAGALSVALTDWPARLGDQLGQTIATGGAELGLRVETILSEGRQAVPAPELVAALGIRRGSPILAFDPDAARARIEALGWVRSAVVERRLPDTIYVRVVERQPIALWQHDGRILLIDRDGVAFGEEQVARFGRLPLVVGADAGEETPKLFDVLATDPELMNKVVSAIRVGGRRWNLRFESGFEARLPEANVEAAWLKLSELVRGRELLKQPVLAIDLRLPDRAIIRLKPAGAEKTDDTGTT
jgi:cell division protein FtsQ